MIIRVHEPETLSLQFPYNPAVIQQIKQISGYRWNPEQKIWTLPNTSRVIKELQARFPTAFWDGAAKAAPERVSTRKKVEEIDGSDVPDRPDGFRSDCFALRPYQKVGAKFCVTNERVLLADAMGVGKSVTAIASVELAKKQNCLIVCQAANLETWNQEISKWTGRVSIEVNAKNRKKLAKIKPLDFKQMVLDKKYVVTNYEMLGKFDFFKAYNWDAVVIDEAHNFRSPRAIRSRNARALKSSMFLALTGTPVINRPIEMFPVLDMITRGDFGTFTQFWETYCGGAMKQVMVGAFCPMCRARRKTLNAPCWKCQTTMPAERQYRDVPDYSVSTNMDDLKRRLEGVMIARKRSDVLTELPDYQRIDRVVRMTAEQQKQYDHLMTDLLTYLLQHKRKDLDSAVRSANSEALTRIGYARQHLAMCKVAAAVEEAKEAMEAGDSVILFTNYQDVAYRTKELIEAHSADDPAFRCFLFTGDTGGTTRTLELAEWQRTPGSALVCTIEAGGVGLNLQNANRSFFIDMPWTPAIIAQAEARTFRMGQKKETFFTRYFIKDTYDEKLMKMLESKQSIFNKVMDGELDVANTGIDLIGGVVDDILGGAKKEKKGKKK